MASAQMHSHPQWSVPAGTVHGMSHYQQDHGVQHHQSQWPHTPTTTMASYGASQVHIPPFNLLQPQPMQYTHQSHQVSHMHQHAQHPMHHQHAQSHHQHTHLPVRPHSSASSLHSSLPSALPSPVHAQPMAHSHALAPLQHHGHEQHNHAGMGHNVNSLGLASPTQVGRFNQPVPHQVVGQQGIRGVLPISTSESASPEDPFEPVQDADGNWTCKFCGRQYRHGKHLRRHHARHTGETPYECNLCQRKFGRSDVLKRHYHKCATRRGVEVGDHLEGQRGHPRRRNRVNSGGSNDTPSPQSTGQVETQLPLPNGTAHLHAGGNVEFDGAGQVDASGHLPNGHLPSGHLPNGHLPNGHLPNGHPNSNGHSHGSGTYQMDAPPPPWSRS